MTTDRDIWTTAKLVIREHGDQAWLNASQRSDKLLATGDVEGARTWRRVLAAIEQLQSSKPDDGVAAH
jgi:hypothetical protein